MTFAFINMNELQFLCLVYGMQFLDSEFMFDLTDQS